MILPILHVIPSEIQFLFTEPSLLACETKFLSNIGLTALNQIILALKEIEKRTRNTEEIFYLLRSSMLENIATTWTECFRFLIRSKVSRQRG